MFVSTRKWEMSEKDKKLYGPPRLQNRRSKKDELKSYYWLVHLLRQTLLLARQQRRHGRVLDGGNVRRTPGGGRLGGTRARRGVARAREAERIAQVSEEVETRETNTWYSLRLGRRRGRTV